jgi:hypothetical protein
MGCTGSKQTTVTRGELVPDTQKGNDSALVVVAANPAAAEQSTTLGTTDNAVVVVAPVEEKPIVLATTKTESKPTTASAVIVEPPTEALVVPAPVVETPATTTTTSSLVPKYHIDEFGNKIDDVTGGRVWSEAYYQARKDAEFHAVQRGVCFENSKKAFEEDRKKEAKELSEQGKLHGKQMEEANQRAVDEIILPQNLSESEKIDLHGLLVAEAVEATRKFLKDHIARGEKDKLFIITGAGHHSDKAKGPVIKPAIIKLCEEEKWKLQADEDNEGSFTVFLKE